VTAPSGDQPEVEAPVDESTGAPAGPADGAGPDAVAEPGEAVDGAERPESQPESQPESEEPAGESPEAVALAERTADLQRLQAEFLNDTRRVERDRDLLRENATYAVLAPIVEVLDNIDRAREHGPLDDGFKTVAEQLERVVTTLGLTKFGAPGDAFDPTIHEALSHIGEDADVEVTTCKVIAKAGYKIGDRVVRAAQVLVVDPA
jgi:molecular chaperone GrpE